MKKLRVGIYGQNGHQIWNFLEGYDKVEFVASAGVSEDNLSRYEVFRNGNLKTFDTLDDMLREAGLDLVCLCSPMRSEQAKDAIKALSAGVSVYAEKPAALSEIELDEILKVAKDSGAEFHEIADSAFTEPYKTMGRLIREGEIGEVVQVFAQKSYPSSFSWRPEDERVDGGLTMQAGIHGARFIEHTCGVKITDVKLFETSKGAPSEKPALTTASSVIMRFENGGVGSMCINYYNPKTFGRWGYEIVRAFGTRGFIEITDGGRHTRLCNENGCIVDFETEEKPKDYFEMYCEHLLDGSEMPLTLEEELSPLRAVIRMKNSAK